MTEQQLMTAIQAMDACADEAQTISKYSAMLIEVLKNDPERFDEMFNQYNEILGDELNHLSRFVELYVNITGIMISED